MSRPTVFQNISLAVLLAAILAVTPAHATTNQGLRAIHAVTAARHSSVEHLSRNDLAAEIESAADDVLIIDVREPGEYAVSHIPGARRVSPEMTPAAFERRFRKEIEGRKVVLYCSVGVRSTNLASRIRESALKAGATSITNLTGGIFGWHNEDRPLTSTAGPTDLIHPYNRFWSTLIERDAFISYGPAAKRATSTPTTQTDR